MILNNGDVIPSFLSVGTTPNFDEGTNFGNITFTKGEVTKIIYPDDKGSVSKKFIEYDVYIENRQNGTGNGELINNCPLWNPNASGVDRAAWTLRVGEKQPWSKNDAMSNGSKVLVMFLHGEGQNPFILGGIRDPNEKQDPGDPKKEFGHYFQWIFNGLETFIDKNGGFTLTFNGPTKNNGDLDTDKVQESATGTYIKLNEEGSLKLATKDDKQYQEINHKDNKINHLADSEYNINVTNGKIKTSSNGVEFGGDNATDKMLMGSTYRDAERTMHNKMLTALQTIQTLAGVAGAQVSAAGAAAVGPLAALQPGLNGAGGALTGMVAQIANLVSAINAFEGQSAQYLSNKNKLDS